MSWLSEKTAALKHRNSLRRDAERIARFWKLLAQEHPAESPALDPSAYSQFATLCASLETALDQQPAHFRIGTPLIQICARFPGNYSTRLVAEALQQGFKIDQDFCRLFAYAATHDVTQYFLKGTRFDWQLIADKNLAGVYPTAETIAPRTGLAKLVPRTRHSMRQPLELIQLLTAFGANWELPYSPTHTLAQYMAFNSPDPDTRAYFEKILPPVAPNLDIKDIIEQRKISNFEHDAHSQLPRIK